MDLIGVVDLKAGRAVHARGGVRERYPPIVRLGDVAINGDPLVLGHAYVDRFELTAMYAADLDAIAGTPICREIVGPLADIAPLWLDAGTSSTQHALDIIELGATRVIVGLETLSSFGALAEICTTTGPDKVAFSLDVRGGTPLVANGRLQKESAPTLAARATDAGVTALIVIDLARVGGRDGPDVELLAQVREAAPDAMLLAGGGVRDLVDLSRLANVGCDGALVASALYDGTLSAADVKAARRLDRHTSATR